VLDIVTSWDVAMLCEPVLPSEPRANAVHVLPPSAEISAVRSVSRVVVPAPLVYVRTISPLVGAACAAVVVDTKVISAEPPGAVVGLRKITIPVPPALPVVLVKPPAPPLPVLAVPAPP